MNSLNLVAGRAMVSDEGGGPHVPGSSPQDIQHQLDSLFDDELEHATIALKQHLDETAARLALHVRALERRNIPEVAHGLGTIGWLVRFCSMSRGEASGTVKTGRALAHMPTVTTNALDGQVPYRSLQLLAQARDRHPDEFTHHEAVFADTASYLTPTDLRRAINYWEQQVDYPRALADTKRRDRLRSLYLAGMFNGLTDIKGALTPEIAHTVTTALNSLCDPGNLDPDDMRTPAQRRHDALGEISRFWLDHNQTVETSGGEKPHVTITLDYRMLTGELNQLPEFDGVPVDPEAIRRLTCDAGIIPMILGSDSEPLDVGRKTRTIPTALRRALEHRDKGCTWTGCTAPESWCDAHHITHWAHGGETSLKNTRLYCRRHHTKIHNGEHPPPEP
ncbi:MAG: DUF222 domain-containing protein [Actinomycetota bacterium]|nr:DUF222 domain-containing protein [Actinomycetota bacterium]MDK1038333.1 DUF222 domain-containing protein [Actinomycetota bacterium]MDK1104331.1 DUF222 domain-containing protein [Actinomycetota bacterium]